MILEKMERQHPSSYDERKGITKRPVVIVQMPSRPDERQFYTRILEVLGASYSVRDQIGALEGRVIYLLKQLGTQLLFIDEVHHLLACVEATLFLNCFRNCQLPHALCFRPVLKKPPNAQVRSTTSLSSIKVQSHN